MPFTSSHPIGSGISVLIVDDRSAMRDVMRDVLEMTGCIVTEAGSADEALAMLQSDRPQVVVVGEIGSRTCLGSIRAAGQGARIVAVCERCPQPGQCGADTCLTGQFSARQLARAVAD